MTTKSYKPVLLIPQYLVQGISDGGMSEVHTDEHVEKDDLRVAINLSGGVQVLLDGECRLVLSAKGLTIELLMEVPEQ
jgi:hypothetical protein